MHAGAYEWHAGSDAVQLNVDNLGNGELGITMGIEQWDSVGMRESGLAGVATTCKWRRV